MDSFISTIEPFYNNPEKWYSPTPVKDILSMKPQPDNDILLIVGDGWNVLDDLEKFYDFGYDADICAINYSAKIIPKNLKIHHYIAGDSHMPDMQAQAATLKDSGALCHCWNPRSFNFDIRWQRNSTKGWTGTTANLGIKIGIALGYMKIILAGCPMDNGGNWYAPSLADNDIKKFKDHSAHLWKWTEIASRPIGCFIRSMSGKTAELFGEPYLEWLED